MAEQRITNVIVPDVFTNYTLEPSIYMSKFFQSGVVGVDAQLSALLNGGGKIFDAPFWKDITKDSQIPSETVATTVNAITASQQDVRRQFREDAWGGNSLAKILAGDNALDKLAEMVNGYWAYNYDKVIINSLEGIKLDNKASNYSDLFNETSAQFDEDGVYDTQGLVGEHQGKFDAIVVHSKIATLLKKQNSIDYIPISDQGQLITKYLGMDLIIDDNVTVAGGVYTSILFKSGAIQYGVGSTDYVPTELERDASTGFGIDKVYSRREFSAHPVGFSWSDSSVGGTTPTNAELALATNWTRAYNKENSGVVFYDATLV